MVLLWRWLVPLVLCLVLAVPVARGICAVRRRRFLKNQQRFVLSQALHAPLYAACTVLLMLRMAFFVVAAASDPTQRGKAASFAYFWLLDMPNVVMAALSGYLALWAARLVHTRRWPGSASVSSRNSSRSLLDAVYAVFCVALTALVTLLAICRTQGEAQEALQVPRWVGFSYTALIWSALGLVLLRYQAQALRLLQRHRRCHRRGFLDTEEVAKHQRLPLLSAACLQSLTTCSTLLAQLLVTRSISCAAMAVVHQDDGGSEDSGDAWRERDVLLHYFCWEIATMALVLRMLQQTPIAVQYPVKAEPTSAGRSKQAEGSEMLPTTAVDVVQFHFQVPSVDDLITNYVIPSKLSLLPALRRGEDSEDEPAERRYCSVHDVASSVGAEYVECQCRRKGTDGQFLNSALVPLLTEDHLPISDAESTITLSTEAYAAEKTHEELLHHERR
ncbi:hypothetical protein BBJ28_00000802 [Nothophytophthora sp. Chile5]|nr:hypothetical protein BBJ28_00000802 [Nothophytophthora sp. Chile5]